MRPFLFILLVAIALFQSCAPRLYFPDKVNVPAFNEAREFKATVSVKPQTVDGGEEVSLVSPSVDFAYAPAKHIGITASWNSLLRRGGYPKPKNYANSYMSSLSGNRFDIAAGYFKKVGKKSLLEAFGGYGNGSLSDDYGQFSTRYHRLFAHAEAGYRRNAVSVLGGIQFAMHRYYGFSSKDSMLRYSIAYDELNQKLQDFTSINYFFIQPFVNFEFGKKFIAFNTQLGFSGQLWNKYNSQIDGDSNFYLSIGVVCRFKH